MANDTPVLVTKRNNIGWITLNRPNVINSLNVEMVKQIYEIMKTWENDCEVKLVVMEGAGEKGFCAGGDMRRFYDLKHEETEEVLQKEASNFFSIEYQLDELIHRYKKPVVAYIDGVVMGGGVGLSIGASHRIVTERTKWGMPEMNIGFYPDVGASYFLNQLPGYIGRYLALTSEIIDGKEAVAIGVADYLIASKNWNHLKEKLNQIKWASLKTDEINNLLDQEVSRNEKTQDSQSLLFDIKEKIDKNFSYNTIEKIKESLMTFQEDEWANNVLKKLRSYSPISLKVTLEQLKKGKHQTLSECLTMEYNVSMSFMREANFYEGVRAVLVDKDKPKWDPETLEKVQDQYVESFFIEESIV